MKSVYIEDPCNNITHTRRPANKIKITKKKVTHCIEPGYLPYIIDNTNETKNQQGNTIRASNYYQGITGMGNQIS